MNPRTLQRRLCRLGQLIAPADMREWARAMTREIEEIDDPHAALQWATACFFSCVAQRVRTVLRIVAAAARFVLGGYCLVVSGQVAIQLIQLIAGGEITPWKFAAWLATALLFGATAPLVALRRPAAAWTLGAATAVVAAVFYVSTGGALADLGSQEVVSAYTMVGVMLLVTGAAFWLTRSPDTDLTI
jgi:hypothetical protein